MMHVSNRHINYFLENGAVPLRGIVKPENIRILNKGIDRNIAHPSKFFQDFSRSEEPRGTCMEDHWSWEHIPEFEHFFRYGGLAEIAGVMLDCTEIRLLEDQYVQKLPGARAPSPWHQDQPFYRFSGRWLSFWIALDPIAAADSLMIVEGSHLSRQLYFPSSGLREDSRASPFSPEERALVLPGLGGEPPEWSVVSWDLEPGDAIAFDPFVIHGAAGNRSKHRARRFVARFAAEDVRLAPSAVPWATLIADHGLQEGDLLHSRKFPLLWRRDGAAFMQ